MVLRDPPSRREISRIGTCSRLCHRRIMLKNAMSNTPLAPAWSRRGSVQTWVKSQWKNPASPGQFSVEFNIYATWPGGDGGQDPAAPAHGNSVVHILLHAVDCPLPIP